MFWALLLLGMLSPVVGWLLVGGTVGLVLIVAPFLLFAGLLAYALFS